MYKLSIHMEKVLYPFIYFFAEHPMLLSKLYTMTRLLI